MVTAQLDVGSSVEAYASISHAPLISSPVYNQKFGVYATSKFSDQTQSWGPIELTTPFSTQFSAPKPLPMKDLTIGGRLNFVDIQYMIDIPEVGIFEVDFKVGKFIETKFPIGKGIRFPKIPGKLVKGSLTDSGFKPSPEILDKPIDRPIRLGTQDSGSATKASAKAVTAGLSIFTGVKYIPPENSKLPFKEISGGLDIRKTQKGFGLKPKFDLKPKFPWEDNPPRQPAEEKAWVYHFNIHYRTIALSRDESAPIPPPQTFRTRGLIDLNNCNVRIGDNKEEIGGFNVPQFIGSLPYGSGDLALVIKKHWGELWSYCPPGDPDANLWFSHGWDVLGKIYRDRQTQEIMVERWFTVEGDVPYAYFKDVNSMTGRYLKRGRVDRFDYGNLPCLMRVFSYSRQDIDEILAYIQKFVNDYIVYRRKGDFYFFGNYYNPNYNPLRQWTCGWGVRASVWNTVTNSWIVDAPDPSNSLWHHGKAMTFMEITEVLLIPFPKNAEEPNPNEIITIIPPNDFHPGFHETDTRQPIDGIDEDDEDDDEEDEDDDMRDCPCREQIEEILSLVRQIHTAVGAKNRGHILEHRPNKNENPDLVFAFNTIPEILQYIIENCEKGGASGGESLTTEEKINEIYEVLGCNKEKVLLQAPAVISNELEGLVEPEDLEKTVDLKSYPEIIFYLINQITNILGIPGAEIEIPGKIQKATGEESNQIVSKLIIPDIFTALVVLIKGVLNLQDDESELRNFLLRICIESHLGRIAAIDAAYRADAILDYMGAEVEEKELEIPCTFTLPPENTKVKEIDTEKEIEEFLRETKRKIKIIKAKNQGMKKLLMRIGEAASITKAAMSIPIKGKDYAAVAKNIKDLIMGTYQNMANKENPADKNELPQWVITLVKQLEEAYDIRINIDLTPEEYKGSTGN